MRINLLLVVSTFTLLISSCGPEKKPHKNAIGGKIYGGEFEFMSSEKVDNLFPISSVDIYSQRLNSQIYESLLKLDMVSLTVIPSIAESYKVSEDAKTFTFKFRKCVKFRCRWCFIK